ncbi:type II secretion system protein GspD [bacterium]|nr:type II secretion system protein GspD [bacterium]
MSTYLATTRLACALSLGITLTAPAFAVPTEDPMVLKGGAFERTISVSIANLPLKDAIRLVAQKGRLNVVVEDDLPQAVNLDLKDVRLGDALQSLLAMGGLQAFKQGSVLAVVGRKQAFERGLLSSGSRVFTLRYASAKRIAEFLNSSVLTRPYVGAQTNTNQVGQQMELAKADPRTNSVLVVGAPADLVLAERTIASLDKPRDRRIYKLSHANAVQVAALLNATVFNNGNKATETENLNVEAETVTEGQGGVSTGSGTELSDTASVVRHRKLQSQTVQVEAKDSVAVPDSRSNSVIVLGSPETLAIADEVIPQLDRRLKQVAIEVEVIETGSRQALELGTTLSGGQNPVGASFDPTGANPGLTINYDPSANLTSVFRAKLNAMVQSKQAKLLAHPTILATDNSESQINIVDEVIKGMKISNPNLTGNPTATPGLIIAEPIYGNAGVTLNILPKIGEDGTVTLRLHPSVSSVRETQKDSFNNTLSLLSRRELIAQQVTIKSGATLALGGLTQTNTISTRNKFPILGDIPLLGHLFSSTSNQQSQTELMIVVTPKVLLD